MGASASKLFSSKSASIINNIACLKCSFSVNVLWAAASILSFLTDSFCKVSMMTHLNHYACKLSEH